MSKKKPASNTLLQRWILTRPGHALLVAIYGGLTYAFASLAIDSGNLWQYLLVLICVGMMAYHLLRTVKPKRYGKK